MSNEPLSARVNRAQREFLAAYLAAHFDGGTAFLLTGDMNEGESSTVSPPSLQEATPLEVHRYFQSRRNRGRDRDE